MTDLLIVGGGPAGLTLGIMARQMGLSVGVVEAATFPRIAHGDTLPAGIEQYFRMLGISRDRLYRDALTFSGLDLEWGGTCQSVELDGNEGLHLPRHLLEPLLLERAHEVGLSILQPCVVKRLLTQNDKICGISTDRREFQAHFVVDAAGSRHWLARKLRIPIEFYSPPLYGYYNWARGFCAKSHERPLITSLPTGWVWTSRVQHPDLYQYTRLTFEPLPEAAGWLPDHFREAGLRPIGPIRGADMTWRVVSRPAGPRFFMIGDAVRRNDPMTNRGFELAMADACKVALWLGRWKRGEVGEEEMARAYVEEIKTQYLQGLEHSYAFLSGHPQAPDWLKRGYVAA